MRYLKFVYFKAEIISKGNATPFELLAEQLLKMCFFLFFKKICGSFFCMWNRRKRMCVVNSMFSKCTLSQLVLFKSSMFEIRKRRIALLQFVYLEWSMIIRNFPFALLGVGSLSFQFAFVLPLLRFLWKVYSKSKFLLYTGWTSWLIVETWQECENEGLQWPSFVYITVYF